MKRVRFIPQNEHSECGLSVAAMLLSPFKSVNLIALREQYGIPKGGLSIHNIIDLLGSEGLTAKAGKVEGLNFFNQISQPCILFWDKKHYVVFLKKRRNKFYIIDPEKGRMSFRSNEFSAHFSKYVVVPVEYRHNGKIDESTKKSCDTSILKKILKQNKLSVAHILVLALIIEIIGLINPIISKKLIDNPSFFSNISNTIFISILCVALLLIYYFLQARKNIYLTKFQIHMNKDIIDRFMYKIFHVPLSFFTNRSSGDLIFRANLINVIQQMMSQQLFGNLIDISFAFVYLIMMLYFSPLLSVVTVAVSILVCISTIFYTVINKKINGHGVEAQTKVQKAFVEIFTGIETIKTSGAEKDFMADWQGSINEQFKIQTHQGVMAAWLSNISSSLLFLLPTVLAVVGGFAISQHKLTFGTLIGFNTLSMAFIQPFTSVVGSVAQIVILKSYFAKILDVINVQTTNLGNLTLKRFSNLELKNVSYKFSSFEKETLKHVTLHVKSGEKIAIVGESGSGKSTLLKVMTGLFAPTDGTVLVNNKVIERYNHDAFFNKISFVNQQPTIFNATLRQNLIMDNQLVSDEKIKKVLKITSIDNKLYNENLGLDTILSENGANLSGGQRQKIAISRAMLRDPEIMFLDEPTSSLDNISEDKIINSLLESEQTEIVVAHRLNTIRNFDRILVMKDGAIVEEGSHAELLSREGSEYAKLYKVSESQKKLA